MINLTIKIEHSVNNKASPAGTHPLVLGTVTVCDVGHGPGRVQGFGVSYQCPAEKHMQNSWKFATPHSLIRCKTSDLSDLASFPTLAVAFC